jgi:ribosome-binding factor A
VTDVRVSDNLRDAKVYVTVRRRRKRNQGSDESFAERATFVRQQVALSLDLRHAPHLHFVRDTAEENAARIGEFSKICQKGEFQEKE